MLLGLLRSVAKSIKKFLIPPIGAYFGLVGKSTLRQTLTVFCFHDISKCPGKFSLNYGLNIPPDCFDYQINFIKKNFNIIAPYEIQEERLPERAALITFDDGFRSFVRNAVPILKSHNVPVLLFVNLEPVQGKIFWSGLITYLCEKRKDFLQHLKRELGEENLKSPLYLSCSKAVVTSYLNVTNEDIEKQVCEFVGEFADEEDLRSAAEEELVFYGNHLYNHYIPLLMSDCEFLDQYQKNDLLLKHYSNYLNYFSFPFGQPGSCFSDKQVNLLRRTDVQKAFYSSGGINNDQSAFCLDRIALSSSDDTGSKIWFQIFRHRLKALRAYIRLKTVKSE
jgi:peptidoglycan/xylan/chitin deacetylase (PgdA/CDA1 family)